MAGAHNETIIAEGVKVDGDFVSQGDVIIDGEVTGSVQTDSALRIGESAKIRADVSARSAVISGEVQGNVRVTERLDLTESALVHGDVEARLLSIAPGARLNGRVSMGNEDERGAEEK